MDYSCNYIACGMAVLNISAEWAEKLSLFDHEEALNDRRETRRHVYISNMPLGSEHFVSNEPDPLQVVCMMETNTELIRKLDTLTPVQIDILRRLLEGKRGAEIARELGISRQSVQQSIELMRKKFSRDT